MSEPVRQAAGCRQWQVSGPLGGDGSPGVFSCPGGGLTGLPASSGTSATLEPSGILPLTGEFFLGRDSLEMGAPSSWPGGRLPSPLRRAEDRGLSGGPAGSLLTMQQASGRHCGGRPGGAPCGQTGRAGPRGLHYPGSSCWGLLAPLKVETWHEGSYFLSRPPGEAHPTAPGFSRRALCTRHTWDWSAGPGTKHTGQARHWPLGRSGQGLKPLKKMAAERADV